MEPENSATPPSSAGSGQNTADDSLYAQITAEDVIQPARPKKPRASLFIQGIVRLMQITFYLDSVKRTHESIFRILAACWALFMTCIYLGGALTLLFGVYHVMQLPLFIEGELRKRGLEFEEVQLADYSLSRIEITNLKDKDGQYEVGRLIINSTFADFLRKRIRSVTLEDLKVNVASQDDRPLSSQLPAILSGLRDPSQESLGLAIDGIDINNAVVNFSQGQMTLPISFGMNGIYTGRTEVVIPLTIKEQNLSVTGQLISSADNPSLWTLNILQGSVTLPKHSPEDLKGTVKLKIAKGTIENIELDLHLTYGTLEKNLVGTLTSVSKTGMNASLILTENNLTEPDLSNQIRLSFGELTLDKNGLISHQPIQVYVQSFTNSLMKLKELHTVVNGDLLCPNWYSCTFSLKEQASVTVQESRLSYQGKTAHGTEENSFVLQPSENTLYLSFYDPYLKLNWKLDNLNFAGYMESEDDTISVQAESADMIGYFSDAQNDMSRFGVSAKGVNLTTNKLQFVNGDISISDVLSPTREVQVAARQVKFSPLPLLMEPFDVKLAMVGSQSTIRLQPNNTDLVVALDGQFMPFQSMFAGKIQIPTFDLAKTKVALSGLAPVLTSNISNLSGQMAVSGRLVWKGQNSLEGPLTMALKDVSFNWAGTPIRNLNSVLEITSLMPFATDAGQRVFVGEIDSVVPFMSTNVTFQVENQTFRLMSLLSNVGGVEVNLPASMIPLRNPNVLLFLKNTKPIDLKKLHAVMNLPQVSVFQGNASVSIPLEVQEAGVSIPSITLKLENTTLQNQQNSWPSVFNGESSYMIRSGQLVMNKNREMQVTLDGRLYPSRSKKAIELKKVMVPEDILKKGAMGQPPKSILNAQKPFFAQ
ncbi:MAG: hypothetical protein J6Y85_02595 [Alphaproteobacteria bacterium]|nr:hypothetical protein [Alphaproteobacteria bacterium]